MKAFISTRKNSLVKTLAYLESILPPEIELTINEQLILSNDIWAKSAIVFEDEKNYIAQIIKFLNDSDKIDNVIVIQNFESYNKNRDSLKQPMVITLDFLLGDISKMYEETSSLYLSLKKNFPETPIIGYTNWEDQTNKISSDSKKLTELLNANLDSVYDKNSIGDSKSFNNVLRDKMRISNIQFENRVLKEENEYLNIQLEKSDIYKAKVSREIEDYIEKGIVNPTFGILERPLVGNSEEMFTIKYWIETFTTKDNSWRNLHLFGESGTGKENIARAIHRLDRKRCQKPFVVVDCTTIQEELFESEVFGYEKGAFTGASERGKIGLAEEADGGVLFLDEIGDLSLRNQSKILRLIQEKSFRRIHGKEEIKVDLRIISASHKSLKLLVADGAFREDLLFRLQSFFPDIPNLKNRKDDIPDLIKFYSKKYGFVFSQEAVQLLKKANFPGNIRSLVHLFSGLSILFKSGDIVEIRDVIKGFEMLGVPLVENNENLDRAKHMLDEILRIVSENKMKPNFKQDYLAKHFVTINNKSQIRRETFVKEWNLNKDTIITLIQSDPEKYAEVVSKCGFVKKHL